ncbi:hypothetical protein SAMN06297144_1190 [Sphingomonas guangdongensis]|uniref:Metallo-beta-lactamase superfamily protein n=1 Tax=Sphingomonas guangdongensis TaxID=1141890 RepID=A0A285QFJ0_9SPHN|nr:hypothetical protein [Sphingomonas guangdongensis]SOB80690.1 hypothetical protein SAMN06297144_1190 [Sphingomonas guangdongensis]
MTIEVTMYDVGLGSAVLLTFKDGDHTVRVLADGGDARAGIRVEESLKKLLTHGTGKRAPLDLVIGTHYDADHLDGLTHIIKSGRVDIRQLWLPPIADDESGRDYGRLAQDESLLVNRFRSEDGSAAFETYVRGKDERRRTLSDLDRMLAWVGENDDRSDQPKPSSHNPSERTLEDWRRVFGEELEAAYKIVGTRGCEHVPDADLVRLSASSYDIIDDLAIMSRPNPAAIGSLIRETKRRGILEGGHSLMAARAQLAHMRVTNAKNAINAVALKALLNEIPTTSSIIVESHRCSDHRPKRFRWTAGLFVRSAEAGGVTATLLSPTDRLVADRRDRLPSDVIGFGAKRWDRLEGLSHSNQLSYVIRFDAEGQGVLITGDSGFDGFARGRDRASEYESGLTDHLKGLSVIQAPHHGGISRHFYRAINSAGFAKETAPCFLLLSHERHSAHRPATALPDYLSTLPAGHGLKLLFTSEPAAEQVAGCHERFASVTKTDREPHGEIVLKCDKSWSVIRHTVSPPST